MKKHDPTFGPFIATVVLIVTIIVAGLGISIWQATR